MNDVEYDVVARSVYAHYEASLRSMRAFDFDDLVLAPGLLTEPWVMHSTPEADPDRRA